MKIIVLGSGAIGSLYGAKLSRYNDVILVGRPNHVAEINKKGLKITGEEESVYKIKATTVIDDIDDNSLILLTTKVINNKSVIESIKNLIKKNTIILCLQNGLESEDIVKSIIGDRCTVLRGITAVGSTFLKPGVVQFNNLSYTKVEKSPLSDEIVNVFNKCGLKAEVSENIKEDIWKKLVVNCILNPISAILRIDNGTTSEERLNPLKTLVLEECLKVADKECVDVGIRSIETINSSIKGSRNLSSMHQDILKGKKTEIDFINGAIVKIGKMHGIKTPVNEALIAIIKEMENST
jgi:2-dehydropantoate 2-reductase